MAKQQPLCLIVPYGQSNEQGVSVTPFDRLGGIKGVAAANLDSTVRFQAAFGPNQVGVTAGGSTNTAFMASLFQLLAEAVARETGRDVRLINNALGGQAVIEGWTGWDGALLRPKLPGEAGYDPNARIAKNATNIQQAIADGYEVWAMTAGHQADFSNGHTVAQIVAANTTVMQQAALAGASKLLVGVTWRQMYTNSAKWDAGGDYLLIRDGLMANLKALGQAGSLGNAKAKDVLLGGDLSPNTDIRLCANDNLNYIHMNHAGTCWSAEVWLNALKAAGLI